MVEQWSDLRKKNVEIQDEVPSVELSNNNLYFILRSNFVNPHEMGVGKSLYELRFCELMNY